MEKHNKIYGFTIAVKELRETVPNIFRYASAYKRVYNITTQGLWEMFVEKQEKKPVDLPEDDPKYQKPLPDEILMTEPGAGALPTSTRRLWKANLTTCAISGVTLRLLVSTFSEARSMRTFST